MNDTTTAPLPLKRKLAAILAADFVSYSRLMHADEEQTLATLTSHRQIVNDLIIAARGTVAGTAGDSILAEFASVVDAYRCAVAIQQAMARANADLPHDRQLRLRIGVHTGDVVHIDGDILGDDVNIACRIESMADVDGICVTRAVRDHLRDHVDAEFEDLGEQSVKNIARPVRVFKALFDAAAEPQLPDFARSVDVKQDPESPAPAASDAVELAFWQSVQASDDDDEYRLYLDRYPNGVFAHLARKRLENGGGARNSEETMVEVAFWETVKDSGKPEMVQAYLDKYPDGEFKALADIMLAGVN